MTDHYKVLGVRRKATQAEIKASYRALAREHHPDVSGGSSTRFLEIKEAYEVLSDASKRAAFDAALTYTENVARQQETAAAAQAATKGARDQYFKTSPSPPPASEPRTAPQPTASGSDVLRLTTLFRNGRLKEAEEKAMDILSVNPHQPVALAVIADLARMRGNLVVAQKYYALAAQYDPGSSIYLKRQQEMAEAIGRPVSAPEPGAPPVAASGRPGALGFAAVLIFGAMVYVAAMRDVSLGLPLVKSWSASVLVGLGLSGLILGAMLSASNAVGRFSVTQGGVGRIAPGAVLLVLALLNFWLAGVFYLVVGSIQRAMNESLLRVLGAVAAVVALFGLAGFTRSTPLLWETLIWGGNVVYFGAVVGWFVADALKPR
jgi:tetratricopeptide (TPR) repeat protein